MLQKIYNHPIKKINKYKKIVLSQNNKNKIQKMSENVSAINKRRKKLKENATHANHLTTLNSNFINFHYR